MASILQVLKYTFIAAVLVAFAIGLHTYLTYRVRGADDKPEKTTIGSEIRSAKERIEGDVRDVLSTIERPFKRIEKEVKADVADLSTIQRRSGKGYCYVGTDKGYRSCIYVGNNDKCMSEEIYPSRDICVNPKLRM